MKLKSLLWTVLLAIVVFFSVVYFGIKYNWVHQASPKYTQSEAVQGFENKGLPLPSETPTTTNRENNGPKARLIGEKPLTPEAPMTLGSDTLTIEEVVSQCHDLASSVGMPSQRFDQAVMECVNRNSTHLTGDNTVFNERDIRVREQCELAITQKELLSTEEIKILTDECVASMQ